MNIFELVGNFTITGIEAASASLDGIGNAMNNIGNNLINAGNTITNFGNTLMNNVTKPLIDLTQYGLEYSMTMEDLQTNFKVMLGSEKEAIDMTAKLTKMGAETPFEVKGLSQATKTLLNFGIEQDKVIPIMSRLGDVSLGNNERFQGLALVMGQVSSLGKLQAGDLNQLINRGWNPLTEIMKRTGESMEDIRGRMRDGAVSYKEVEQALIDATSEGGRFHDGMIEGSKNLSGKISTLKDNFDMFLQKAVKPLFDFASQKLIPKLTDLVGNLSKLDDGTIKAIGFFALLLAGVAPLVIVFGTIVTSLGLFTIAVGALLNPITIITGLIAGLVAVLGAGGLAGVLGALPQIKMDKLVAIWETIKDKASMAKEYLEKQWLPAIKYLLTGDELELAKIRDTDFKNSLKTLKEHIDDWAKKINDKFGEVNKALGKIDEKKLAKVSTEIVKMVESCMDLVDGIMEVMKWLDKLAAWVNKNNPMQKMSKDSKDNIDKIIIDNKRYKEDMEKLPYVADQSAKKIGENFATGIQSKVPASKVAFTNMSNQIERLEKSTEAKDFGRGAGSNYEMGILQSNPGVGTSFTWLGDNVGKLNRAGEASNHGSNTGASFGNGVRQQHGNARDAANSLSGAVSGALSGLSGWSWGNNLGSSFAAGLSAASGVVGVAAAGVAGMVHGYLGHSSPTKLGTGRFSDKWMPNLIKMLVQGLNDGSIEVGFAASKIAKNLATNISPIISGNRSGFAAWNSTGNVTMTNTFNIAKEVDAKKVTNEIMGQLTGKRGVIRYG